MIKRLIVHRYEHTILSYESDEKIKISKTEVKFVIPIIFTK